MGSLNITWGELQHLQEIDETLETVWKAVEGKTVDAAGYFKKDGLLYRHWVPRGEEEVMAVDQIDLPKKCRTLFYTLHTLFPLQSFTSSAALTHVMIMCCINNYIKSCINMCFIVQSM